MHLKPSRGRALCVALAVLLLAALTQAVARADGDVCGMDGGNDPTLVSVNCRFEGKGNKVDGFGLVRSYWNPFITMGTPHFDTLDTHNGYDWLNGKHEGDQKIDTQGKAWSAGVWQSVPNVIAGHGYRAEAGWAVSQNTTAQGRIGIDPTGGTDPNSANIVWSQPILLCRSCHYVVQAYAAGPVLTVFMQVTIAHPQGSDNSWITAIGVKPDPSMPPATPTASPTATATATSTRVPPTRTPTKSPATATAVPSETATTTATATPSATPTDTDTPEPTATDIPAPTATRRPTPTPTLEPVMALNIGNVNGGVVAAVGLLGLSTCGLAGTLALGGGTLWYWRRRERARGG